MPNMSVPPEQQPWEALGFGSEREMLLDDLRTLDRRIKDPSTTATAVAALSRRKHDVFEMIKSLDSADGDDDILDDEADESWQQ